MKLIAGWAVSAGLLLAATAAHAQGAYQGSGAYDAGRSPYAPVSDFDGPAYPPEPVMPPPPPRYGDGVSFMPPHEVYEVLRETGFSPIGAPHLRGFAWVITAIDRRGDDGRLVIDARTGRILSFTPAYRMGDSNGYGYGEDAPYGPDRRPYRGQDPYDDPYGPRSAAPGPMMARPDGLRPPAPIPHVASHAMPVRPQRTAMPAPASRPEPAPQRSAAAEPRPARTAAAAPPAPQRATVGEVKPLAQPILPTQPMPKAQDLEY